MGRLPLVIVTDESAGAKAGIRELVADEEWDGQHLLDIHHVLANIRKQMKRKEDIRLFAELAACPNPQKYTNMLPYVLDALDIADTPLLEPFLTQSQRYCFSQIRTIFFGFSANTASCEKLNDLIKTAVPDRKSFVVAIKRILSVCHRLI